MKHCTVRASTSWVLLALLAAGMVWAGGCSSARRGEPLHGPLPVTDARVERGRLVFMQHCQKCHPGGEAGLGPALNDKPFPKFLQHFQVYHGLGAMPALSPAEIAEAQLDDLLEYVHALRRHG
jgi:mono/diheme cytochrome c family protein